MAQKSFIPLQNLDFNTYKASLKEFLKTQEQFRDYDFEGSNLSVLLDLLTHNTVFNAFYLNMIGSEMFLDTAQLRDSIVSHAKELNYTPRSRASAVAVVNIRVTPNDNPATITIPKYYPIAGTSPDGTRFIFLTNEQIILSSSTNYTAFNVSIYEGSIVREAFEAQRNSRFILQNSSVDTSSIEVEIQNSRADTTLTAWERATALFGLAQDSKVFFVQAADSGRYELSFGNGVVGEALAFGNIIRATYRITAGPEANGVRTFSRIQDADGYSNINIETVSAAASGSLEETTEDIRFSAPRYFATQERAVTASDFVTLIRNRFQYIQAANAYGGENAVPRQYGKVFIAAKPKDAEFLSDAQKREIQEFARTRCTLSIDPVVVDPEFLYIVIQADVKYDPTKSAAGTNGIEAAVRTAITAFNESTLATFGADLRRSKLIAAIDGADNSIVSNQTKTLMSRRVQITPGVDYSGTLVFGQPLKQDNGTAPTIFSSSFLYSALDTQINARFVDDGNGNMRIVDSAGEVLKDRAGRVDYAAGTVSLDAFKLDRLNETSVFKLYAEALNDDVETNNNIILLIDDEDVTVRAAGVRI
jgi:hypothetical protein